MEKYNINFKSKNSLEQLKDKLMDITLDNVPGFLKDKEVLVNVSNEDLEILKSELSNNNEEESGIKFPNTEFKVTLIEKS